MRVVEYLSDQGPAIMKELNKRVKALDGKGRKEPFFKVVERRLSVEDMKGRINHVFEILGPIIGAKGNQRKTLAHGDVAPNNLYIYDSGEVELLDLEWVEVFENSALAMINDFGNLHSRSWKNKVYRYALEEILLDHYRKQNKEKLGAAILCLGILTKHIHHSRYFENYDWTKQNLKEETERRRVTEQEILRGFELLAEHFL